MTWESQKRSITILDVGHGNAAVIEDGDYVLVIDAGPGAALKEFLLERGIGRINTVLISHADKDHIEGLLGLLSSAEITIDRVRVNSDALKGSRLWDDLLYELDVRQQAGIIDFQVSLTRDVSGQYNAGKTRIDVLGPSTYLAGKSPGSTLFRTGQKVTTNSVSAVIRVQVDGKPLVLLTGDLDAVGLEDLKRGTMSIDAPILVFPHHGGGHGSGDVSAFVERICDEVKPTTIIFSIGRGRFGTPRPEIIKVVRERRPDVRIVCTQLSEHCATTIPKPKPTHLLSAFARGRQRGHCCAGTLTLGFVEGVGVVLPDRASHEAFIAATSLTTLCRRGSADVSEGSRMVQDGA